MKKSTSKQTKVKKDQMLWQEIPENAQDKISAGGQLTLKLPVWYQADSSGSSKIAGFGNG